MMNPSTAWQVPPSLAAMLARLPVYPGSVLLAKALNVGLAPRLPEDVRAILLRKRIRIEVRDARLAFNFSWAGNGFSAIHANGTPDLTIAASAHDFLLLAQRREDPDTLFFSRRLSMLGDTELGLVVKNALDALELPPLDPRQWTPARVLAAIAPHAQRNGVGPRHPGPRE
jgi:O2-independent ubiquinone biosynthesis accessory factor UbiT